VIRQARLGIGSLMEPLVRKICSIYRTELHTRSYSGNISIAALGL
jgi:hypothetical protein